jgi:hypothetical protein
MAIKLWSELMHIGIPEDDVDQSTLLKLIVQSAHHTCAVAWRNDPVRIGMDN